MIFDTTIKAVIVTLLLVISAPTIFFFWKVPATRLSDAERELTTFSSQPLETSPKRSLTTFSGLGFPVQITSKQQPSVANNIQPTPISTEKASQLISKPPLRNSLSSLPSVSMIYSEGDTNVAIIGGNILREGSSFSGNQVVKIEKTRVLIKSAGKNIWLNMD